MANPRRKQDPAVSQFIVPVLVWWGEAPERPQFFREAVGNQRTPNVGVYSIKFPLVWSALGLENESDLVNFFGGALFGKATGGVHKDSSRISVVDLRR